MKITIAHAPSASSTEDEKNRSFELEFDVVPRVGEWLLIHESQMPRCYQEEEPFLSNPIGQIDNGFYMMRVGDVTHLMDPVKGHRVIIDMAFDGE